MLNHRLIRFYLLIALHLITTGCFCQTSSAREGETINVANEAQLEQAVDKLTSNTSGNVTVLIADGVYQLSAFEKVINNSSQFTKTIKAVNNGKARLKGDIGLRLAGNNIILEGLDFTRTVLPAKIRSVAEIINGSYCRIEGCTFSESGNLSSDASGVAYYCAINNGAKNIISGCRFISKKTSGGIISISSFNNDTVSGNHHKIENNYFGPRPFGSNAFNFALKVGSAGDPSSETSTVHAQTTISNNTFEGYDAYSEIISNKSSYNFYVANTFTNCAGYISLRSGSHCVVKDCIFNGQNKKRSSGVFVSGPYHVIRNNVFKDLENAGIVLLEGNTDFNSFNDAASSPSVYFKANNLTVSGNKFINTTNNITFSHNRQNTSESIPENIVIENNEFSIKNSKSLVFYEYGGKKIKKEELKKLGWKNNKVKNESNEKPLLSNIDSLDDKDLDLKTDVSNQTGLATTTTKIRKSITKKTTRKKRSSKKKR